MSSPALSAVKTLNERLSKQLSKYDSSHANSMKASHNRLTNALEGLVSMRDNPNSTETASAHVLKLSKAAKRMGDEVAKMKERAFQNYMEYDLSISNQIADRAGIQENKYASEVRAAFKALPQAERLDFITEVINKEDGASFAAIMGAPQILTGIDPAMNAALTESFYNKVAPELLQEHNDVKEAMDALSASFKTIEREVQTYMNPENIQRIEQEVQRSMEAQDKFSSALA